MLAKCSQIPLQLFRHLLRIGATVFVVEDDDPLAGQLFVFYNRAGDKLKMLYYDGQGLCQWYNRLNG